MKNYFNEQQMQCRELSEEIAIEISALSNNFEEADDLWSEGLEDPLATRALVGRAFARTEEDELFWGCDCFDRLEHE